MKKILSIFIMLTIVFMFNFSTVKAETIIKVKSLSDNSYQLMLNIRNKNSGDVNTIYSNQKLSEFDIVYSLKKKIYNEKTSTTSYGIMDSTYEWENPEYMIINGLQDVNVLFTLSDESKLTVTISIAPFDFVQNTETEYLPEEEFTTALTANTITLENDSSYDINISDKIEGATYKWSSSDENIATVNKSGIVNAKSNGKAKITCTIITSNKSYELFSEVTVGIDDNYPILSDETVDISVKDTYDIDVENVIKKSKYKWSSSDKNIVKVNTNTGVITGLKSGTADVICTILAPNKEVIVLKCQVTVE